MTHIPSDADNHHDPDRATREQILDAAQGLFLARGYKAVAMKDIAEAVHITSAALYYHFPQGKEEVLLEMLRAMIAAWIDRITRSVAQGGTLPEQLRRLVSVMRSLPFDSLPLIMRDIHTQLPDAVREVLAYQGFGSLLQQVVAVFQRAIDAGEIDAALPAPALAQLLMGMILGTMQNFPPEIPKGPTLDNVDEIIVTVLLYGIAARP